MNVGFKPKRELANAALIAVLAVAGAASAQTLPKEGNYDITSCWSGVNNVIAFSKTQSVTTSEMTGTARSNLPGGIFDNMSFRCVGLSSSLDGKRSAHTVCEAIDRDGDKSLSDFSFTSDGTLVRKTIAGTGKYEGMVESGTATPLGSYPPIKPGTFQNCNRQTGTYKLK